MFLIYFLLGIAVLFLLYAAAKSFAQAKPAQLVTGLRVAGGVGAALAALWLLLTGRISLALMLASVFAPLLARWRAAWRAGRASGSASGQTSDVETAWLRMRLDHDTGILHGTVLQGRFAGRFLGEMTIPELAELLARLRVNDPDSASVLEAYLDRTRPEWRDDTEGGAEEAMREAPPSTAGAGAMTREEAYRILGLPRGADEKAIRDAHRKLMLKLHPDQGGSTYLAAKINQAKDLLIKG